jgi:flagellar basal-body rod protein FlgF
MSGAMATMQAQKANTSNIANADTVGFRTDLAAFRDAPVAGVGLPSRVGVTTAGKGWDFSPGPQVTTGRDLDIAVQGHGWIAVQTPDGGEAYTRAGDLRVTEAGLLTTRAGQPVLGNSGPVALPPHSKVSIGDDGTISAIPLGAKPNAIAVLDRIKLVNPPEDQLAKGNDGLMHLRGGEPVEADANVRVDSGELEQSNVNAADAMVRMIELARQFQMQVKEIRTANENGQASQQLLRMT